MKSKEEILFTFSGTSHAIGGERALLEAGIQAKVMPLPPLIKAGCGICLRVSQEDVAPAKTALSVKGIAYEGLYLRQVIDGKSHYQSLEESR